MNDRYQFKNSESLRSARAIMAISSMWPIFILIAIRGNSIIPDLYLTLFCILLSGVPALFLFHRISVARKEMDRAEITVGKSENHRLDALIYVFSLFLPFYRQDLDSYRELIAIIMAIIFIMCVFWRFNLYYMNPIFLIQNYNTFLVFPPDNNNQYTDDSPFILITKRKILRDNDKIIANRISSTVYIERNLDVGE